MNKQGKKVETERFKPKPERIIKIIIKPNLNKELAQGGVKVIKRCEKKVQKYC